MKKNIDYDELYNLYIIENKSSRDIAIIYNCSPPTVRKFLKSYNIIKDKNTMIKARTDKMRHNNLIKYGVESTSQLDAVKNKMKQTCLEKYGTTCSLHNKEIQQKVKDTWNKNYGTDNPMKSKLIQEKSKKTCLRKYGVEYSVQNPDILQKIKNTNLEKYGVLFPLQSDAIFQQTINSRNKETTYTSRKMKLAALENNLDLLNKISLFNDNEAFSIFIQENMTNKSLHEIADFFEYNYNSVQNKIKKLDLQKYVKLNPPYSSSESEIVEFLINELQIKNVERNARNILDNLEIDIYLPDYKIGIEFNGSYWHSDNKKDKFYHQNKSLKALEKDIFLYHIFDYEWEDSIVKEKIKNHLKNLLSLNSYKIYGRQCTIKEIPSTTKNMFLEANHLQGKDISKINLGLFYNDELVSVMTFTKPRFTKKYTWELSRFCSKQDFNIIGGASKLFKYFVNTYLNTNETIISYSNLTKNKGSIYKILNFKLSHISEPNYIWWKNTNDWFTRYNTMGKNENEKMRYLGYAKVYNSGNMVYIFKK